MNDPFALSDALVDAVAALRPVQATFMGVAGHDDRWDDLSPDGVAHVATELAGWRRKVDALPPPTDRWDRLAVHVARDWLDQELDRLAHHDPEVDLNSLSSSLQLIRMAFDSMDTTSAQGWENVAARLERLPEALAGYRRMLDQGRARGHVVAARQVRAGVAQARVHAGEKSGLRDLPRHAVGTADPTLVRRVEAAVPGACAAFGDLAAWLTGTYLPHAALADGVGRERYVREMRRFLGATPDPEETYAWGWEEVRRIQAQMLALADRIAPGASIPAVTDLLSHDPARCAPDKASFLAAMRECQEKALAALDGTHFDIPAPVRRIDVREAPTSGTLGAYYVAPSEDFSRPGTVWYLLPEAGPYPLWREVSTAWHEGFPGHHLQVGTQVSLTAHLSRLHRVADGYSGYAEGWALYVEELMEELGLYEKPEYTFGMLANQVIRACRVVFDIGAHLGLPIPADAPFHPGEAWSWELGVAMMTRVGGLSRAHAESEVTRYLGFPAQAISYKVGQRVMSDLRREFRGSPKEFHARVLGCGNVGLDLLRELVMEA
jgi:uncharacterized protein (DUF885 family)